MEFDFVELSVSLDGSRHTSSYNLLVDCDGIILCSRPEPIIRELRTLLRSTANTVNKTLP